MSDADDIESIRERKLERLRAEHGSGAGEENATSGEDASGAGSTDPPVPDAPIHVESGEHFRTVIEDHRVVLVDFYADWCGPCQMMEPVLGELAADLDTAAIAKVDTDAQGQLAADHGVRSLPTLLLFVEGEPVEQLVGAQDGQQLRTLIDRYV
jgi:thioredoxin 1